MTPFRAPVGLDEALLRVAARVLPGVPTSPSALAPSVRALSDRYNGLDAPMPDPDHRLAAQILFFLPADVGKVPVCLDELRRADRLPGGVLRVLDLGAGPGTASVGARLALPERTLEIVLVDREARNLETARALHEALGPATVRLVSRDLSGGTLLDEGPFDLVLAQALLWELPEAVRASVVRAAISALGPRGVAIVIEPALRASARSLHRVRDEILASGAAHVFAPCVRQGPCPALDRETDWCHEDKPWEPTERVAEIARLAGLRRSGLKFAYATFVLDGANVGAGTADAYRVVSDVLATKGKAEAFLCGHAGRLRTIRLNRNRSEANAELPRLVRGDVVRVDGLDPARPRIGKDTAVRRI